VGKALPSEDFTEDAARRVEKAQNVWHGTIACCDQAL
jgi:hypothetical protein